MALFKKWFGRQEPAPSEAPAEDAPAPDAASADAEASEKTEAAAPPGVESASESKVPVASENAPSAPPVKEKRSAWSLLKRGLAKTRQGLEGLLRIGRKLDEEYIDELEASLITADFGPQTVSELIDGEQGIRAAWREKRITETSEVREYLAGLLKGVLLERDNRLQAVESGPTVILVVGVNGTGKTTSIAKLARHLKDQGRSVVLAAGDTFRAAAVEQLTIWSRRLDAPIVTGKPGADPASVAFRGAEAALESGVDYLIVDTAGRLHTQANLMRELTKIRDVLAKKIPGAPHEVLLVLDATTGQNAIQQAGSFTQAAQVSGIVLTKLDGTAKGGIVIAVNNRFHIPVKFIGVGEGIDDLQAFDANRFVDALLANEHA